MLFNKAYVPSVRSIRMPTSFSLDIWEKFFNKLLEIDHFAPLYIMIEHCAFLYGLDVTSPPTPYSDLYCDVGIAMAIDAEYPAEDAAIATDFFSKGIKQIASAVQENDEFSACYISVLKALLADEPHILDCLPTELLNKVLSLATVCSTVGNNESNDSSLPDIDDEPGWIRFFERAVKEDSCAEASILEYYLENLTGEGNRIFCPLGYTPYRTVGKLMRENSAVLNAAIQSGLMAGAVPTYVGASLDCVENWNAGVCGIRFLLNSDQLRRFIPLKDHFVAESLLKNFGEAINDIDAEQAWYDASTRLRESFDHGDGRGY